MKKMEFFNRFSIVLFALFLAVVLTGCFGLWDEEDDPHPPPDVPPPTVISGGAFLGPIKGGTVKVFAFADGSKGDQLGSTVTTRADGTYPSIDIGTWTGPVLVKVTGGTYTDRATGAEDQDNPGLHAVLSGVSGAVDVYITPLTEIAYRLAIDDDLGLTIDQANSLVGNMVGVNIINTRPADLADPDKSAEATVDQITYGLMLATISQMVVPDDDIENVSDAITAIKGDLADHRLDTTGNALQTALTNFLADQDRNKSGVDNLDETKLDDALYNIITDPVIIVDDIPNLNKAKALVADLRNTVLSIYNHHGVGVPGIVETPFKRLAEELEEEIKPDLTATVDRIAWIIESAAKVEHRATETFFKSDYRLTIDRFHADETRATFSVTKEEIGEIDRGALTLTFPDTPVNNDPNIPISGDFNAEMTTATGTLTADLVYSSTVSNGVFTSMTFTGGMTVPQVLYLDFRQGDRGLHVELTTWPEDGTLDAGRPFPSRITLSGRITTTTAQMDGLLDIRAGINTVASLPYETASRGVPKSGTFEGSFKELRDGWTTGVKFGGTITSEWVNALAFDFTREEGYDNFPKWNVSFDGEIEAPFRPTITAFLRVVQNEYERVALDVSYRRTDPDGTVVFLSGSGIYCDYTEILTATLTNQDGMIVNISYDDTKLEDYRFSGTITTAGRVPMAYLYTINGIPMVEYIDGFFESIF
ncbi:hypothetical protein M1N66_03835 [Thermodesulfovibrionales bacterium]|nr:hypothetical protein [Thermodesulfovibrionales bacterium]